MAVASTLPNRRQRLVPWKREALHKSRSAARGSQGATTTRALIARRAAGRDAGSWPGDLGKL
ncbi:MAG: hypothetical protein H0X67_11880 [Acidobacteria bacterium]|nr:hypothetical protein [Acidobacteriota bacterium]